MIRIKVTDDAVADIYSHEIVKSILLDIIEDDMNTNQSSLGKGNSKMGILN